MLKFITRGRVTAGLCALSTALSLTLALPATGHADSSFSLPHDLLYVEANSTIAGKNAVLGYHRAADGSLTPLPGSPFLTGGTGWFDPTYAIGPFDADGIMAYEPVGSVLYVPNGGSKSIAALYLAPSGALSPISGSPFAVQGNTPDALALRGDTLVIVDNGGDANNPATASRVSNPPMSRRTISFMCCRRTPPPARSDRYRHRPWRPPARRCCSPTNSRSAKSPPMISTPSGSSI